MWKKNQGASEIYVLVVVIIGAFFLAGGQMIFNNSANTTSAEGTIGTGPAPTAKPTETPASIVVTSLTCDNTLHKGTIVFSIQGPDKGYYSVALKNGENFETFSLPSTVDAAYDTPPLKTYTLDVPNQGGFNTKQWQIQLYTGGTKTGNAWSGGTKAVTKDMDSTKCQ